MKTKVMIFLLLLSSSPIFSQWLTTGNNVFPTDYLGTNNNQPLLFHTNNTQKMKLNGDFGVGQYIINGFGFAWGVNASGYLLLGEDIPNKGAFSMLHINGGNTFGTQELGYRPWMKYGITFTNNNDFAGFLFS